MTVDLMHSAEIRWFFPDLESAGPAQMAAPPPAVRRWFLRDSLQTWPPPYRTDHYLLLPGCDSAGVKLREGRFEIKARCGPIQTAIFPHGVTGLTDSWVKWSYGRSAAAAWIAALRQEPTGWLPVRKWRRLRRFRLDKEKVIEVDVAVLPDLGGAVELTAIQTPAGRWWSLALETSGPPDTVSSLLARLGAHFFERRPPPLPLTMKNSAAYPAWLDGQNRMSQDAV